MTRATGIEVLARKKVNVASFALDFVKEVNREGDPKDVANRVGLVGDSIDLVERSFCEGGDIKQGVVEVRGKYGE